MILILLWCFFSFYRFFFFSYRNYVEIGAGDAANAADDDVTKSMEKERHGLFHARLNDEEKKSHSRCLWDFYIIGHL